MAEGPKPLVGEPVEFYNPELVRKIGFERGYGGRGAGPYAGIVVNDRGVGLEVFVMFPDRQPAFVFEKVPFKPEGEITPQTKAYWDWSSDAQHARAAKRLKDKERVAAETVVS